MSTDTWTHERTEIDVLSHGDGSGPFVVLIGVWNARFVYQGLVEHLTPSYAVAVVTLPAGNDSLGLPVLTVFDEPADFIVSAPEVREVAMSGRPLVVAGHSRTGHVAHEVAIRLAALDCPVALEVLVDTIYPGRELPEMKTRKSRQRRSKYGEILESRDLRRLGREVRQKAGDRIRIGQRRLRTAARALVSDEIPETAASVHPDPLDTSDYTPGPVEHPVVLYRASQTTTADSTDPWRSVAPQLDEVVVPGTHGTLIRSGVLPLAADLSSRLASM